MVRTQIQLTKAQSEALKKIAVQQGQSMAELIRQSVDLLLQKAQKPAGDSDEKRQRAIAISGKFRSGLSDFAVNHDAYLDEAYTYFHPPTKLTPDLSDEHLR